jgi:hypothetical protein
LPAELSNWRHGELMGALRRKVADIVQMQKRLVPRIIDPRNVA